MSDSLHALNWDELVARLGSDEELSRSAREAGALLRKRQVSSATDLLRLCFAYVLGRFSLRTLAAWADQRGLASMSDVAMLRRLKASADWVGDLVSELLAERCPEALAGSNGGLRMMAVDTTVVAPPGPKRVKSRRTVTPFSLPILTPAVAVTRTCKGLRSGPFACPRLGRIRSQFLKISSGF
jgi:hypothetical protein